MFLLFKLYWVKALKLPMWGIISREQPGHTDITYSILDMNMEDLN